jgi:hypothetical protein
LLRLVGGMLAAVGYRGNSIGVIVIVRSGIVIASSCGIVIASSSCIVVNIVAISVTITIIIITITITNPMHTVRS